MYELTYILSPAAGDLDPKTAADKIRSFIADNLAGEIKNEYIGEKKRFSYPIKKQSSGFYVILEFNAESEKINELKKFLEFNNDILRHLILKTKVRTPVKKRPAKVRPAAIPAEEISAKTEKVGIEELDKKLEELLK